MVISFLILWGILMSFCGFFYFLWNEPVLSMLLMTTSIGLLGLFKLLDERVE